MNKQAIEDFQSGKCENDDCLFSIVRSLLNQYVEYEKKTFTVN